MAAIAGAQVTRNAATIKAIGCVYWFHGAWVDTPSHRVGALLAAAHDGAVAEAVEAFDFAQASTLEGLDQLEQEEPPRFAVVCRICERSRQGLEVVDPAAGLQQGHRFGQRAVDPGHPIGVRERAELQ